MKGACNGTSFFGPVPWGGAKRSNIIKFQLRSQFQRFLNQTLCVFSQMKDRKHIRRDFHLAAWVMRQGWDLGVPWGGGGGGGGTGWEWGGGQFFFRNSTRFGVLVTYMSGTCTGTIFFGPHPLGPWEGAKRSNIIVNFKDFKPNFVYLLTNER